MHSISQRIKRHLTAIDIKKTVRRVVFFILGIITLILISSGILAFYFNRNKTEIIAKLNETISEKISGTIHIEDAKYQFLTGFPNVSMALYNVELKDSLWEKHRHSVFKAKEIEVRLNVLGFLDNEISIHKIVVNQATIYLYKDKNGNTNSNIFRPKPKVSESSKKMTASIDEIVLEELHFVSDNEQRNKLFDFDVASLKSTVDFKNEGWGTKVYINALAKSMSFNTARGSFIKDKKLEGILAVTFSKAQQKIEVVTENLEIGADLFDIKAYFNVAKNNSLFGIDIKTKILWADASRLLADNISSKLNRFDLKKPIKVGCTIIGDINDTGDPEIVVKAEVKDNELHIPDGAIPNCTFQGKYTNNYQEGKGYTDANSAIVVTDFSGTYKKIPFAMPLAMITNLEKPIATGKFNSEFQLPLMKEMVNEKLFHFSAGQAKVNLDFVVDIVDYKINKPLFTGNVLVKGAKVNYIPKKLLFEKTDLHFNFTQEALEIKRLQFKDRNNTVFMDCKIKNFLNLYYNSPEKMVVNWSIYCPNLDVKQFIGILANTSQKTAAKKHKKQNFSAQLKSIFDKCQVVLNVKADKMKYAKLYASNAKATILLNNNKVFLKNASLKSAGGTINFDGQMTPTNKALNFSSNVNVTRVDMAQFLTSFNNFGITSFAPKNIKGNLSAKTAVKGVISANGDLITNSISGQVNFDVNKGVLLDFEPIKKVAKFAFPFRKVDEITFTDLNGDMSIKGSDINIKSLKVSSSILNFDVKGIYSFDDGTNLALTIPLRNPKRDEKIADKEEKAERRNNGIVLHLLAIEEEGKMKIKWNKNHEKLE
jgi:hypothetical protein